MALSVGLAWLTVCASLHSSNALYLMRAAPNASASYISQARGALNESGYNIDDGGTIHRLEDQAEDEVVCGNHKAATCAACPQGNGASWCNADCIWRDGGCHSRFPPLNPPEAPYGCEHNDDDSHAEQCRARTGSTHLNFLRPSGAQTPMWYYNEIEPTSSSGATYYASNTHGYGYAGIQMKRKDDQFGDTAICSIWDQDSGGASIDKCGENAECSGFGGEGTGAKAKLRFEWELGRRYAWMLHRVALPDGRIQHTCWFYAPEYAELGTGNDGWKHVATATSGSNGFGTTFKDAGSFLEQWTHEDSNHLRRGLYGPAYYKNEHGDWAQAMQAKFSAYCLPERVAASQVTCDYTAGGIDGSHVYMATGGLDPIAADVHQNRIIAYPAHSSLPEPLASFTANMDMHLAQAEP